MLDPCLWVRRGAKRKVKGLTFQFSSTHSQGAAGLSRIFLGGGRAGREPQGFRAAMTEHGPPSAGGLGIAATRDRGPPLGFSPGGTRSVASVLGSWPYLSIALHLRAALGSRPRGTVALHWGFPWRDALRRVRLGIVAISEHGPPSAGGLGIAATRDRGPSAGLSHGGAMHERRRLPGVERLRFDDRQRKEKNGPFGSR
jgi:hypothetical protein